MPKPTYQRINWENGILVTPAKVLEDNTIQDAIYECDTPLNAENLNKMDKGISDIYEYGITSNEIAISNTQPTNEDTLIWINTDGTIKFKNEDGEWQDTSSSGGENEIIGSAKLFFGNTEPNGYKFLNGQAISRTEYAELFNLIGTTYGSGDGTTTFNLPDMSGRVPVGLNVNKTWFNQLGKIGGSEEVTLTIEQMPSHTHSIGFDQTAGGITSSVKTGTQSSYGMNTGSTGGGQAHTNLQPYMTVNYIMKVKNVASENVIVPDNFPIGGEISYPANTLPDSSWVWSDTNYLISDYPELASLYDGIFDDDTTQDGYFKTPKKAGFVTIGLDSSDTDFNTIGKTIGEKKHTLTNDEMPNHTHNIKISADYDYDVGVGSNGSYMGTGQFNWSGSHKFINETAGGGQPHNNIQPSIVSRFIIKAKRIEPNMSTVIGADDTPNDKDVYSSNAVKTLTESVVAYSNETGTRDDITLNVSASDYAKCEIIYRSYYTNTYYSSIIYNPNGKQVDTSYIDRDSNAIYFRCATCSISNQSIVRNTGTTYDTYNKSADALGKTSNNYPLITKVIFSQKIL